MRSDSKVRVSIGATLSPSYLKTFVSAGGAVKKLKGETEQLNRRVGDIQAFRKQENATKSAGREWKAAREKVAQLKAEIKASGEATAQQTRALKQAEQQAKRTSQAYQQQRERLSQMSDQLRRQGTDVSRLSNEYNRLRDRIRQTTQQTETMESRLKRQQQVVKTMESSWRSIGNIISGVVATGAGTWIAGQQALKPFGIVKNEAQSYETEAARIKALGMPEDQTKHAIHYGTNLPTYGTSKAENLMLMRDAITAFGDTHHAEMALPTLTKMKFANEAFYGQAQGGANERMFMDMLKVIELKGGAKNEELFKQHSDYIQQVITATGGRVMPEDWKRFIARGGVAAKLMRDDAFYYQMEPLIQEQGGDMIGTSLMSAYQNLYQGRTTKRAAENIEKYGLIGDKSKVTADKAGQLKFLNPGALLNYKLYAESPFDWMNQTMLPQLQKSGIDTNNKTQTIDAIASMFSNRRAADLFATMYLQKDMINKSYKMNERAYTIDKLNELGQTTTSGKELEAKAKKHDAELTLGNEVLPTYTNAVSAATEALKDFNAWLMANPDNPKIAVGAGAAGAAAWTAGGIWGAMKLRGLLGGASKAEAEAAKAAAAAGGAKGVGRLARIGSAVKSGVIAGALGYTIDAGAGALGVGKGIDAEAVKKQDDLNWSRATIGEKFQSAPARMIERLGSLLFLDNMANEARAGRVKEETKYLDGKGGDKGTSDAAHEAANAAHEAATAAQEAAKAATIKPNQINNFNTHLNTTINEAKDPKAFSLELGAQLNAIDRARAAEARSAYPGSPEH